MNLDIIGIAETFLVKDVMQAEISIDGFTSYRKDRNSFKEGKAGGVLLYVKNEINSYEYSELNILKSESVWCRVKTAGNENINIGVCYRSQAAEDDEVKELFKAIETASNEQVMIMGDFNYPKINWETFECDSYGVLFRDLLLDNYLFQNVRDPTRENNILDLVISSDVNLVTEVNVLEHLGNSDHNIIVWKLICDVGLTKTKLPVRQYHKANFGDMRNWFQGIIWADEFDGLDVEDAWQKFCIILDRAIDKFVPLEFKKQKKLQNG